MRLLVTRPEPDAQSQAARLRELGHEAILAPLFSLEFLDPGPLPLDSVQALIATSRNALRALEGREEFADLLSLPLFAVGAATARLARDLGFKSVTQGLGTAEKLVPVIEKACSPDAGTLLHPAGEKLAWDMKSALERAGFKVHQPVLYRSNAAERLPDDAAEAINAGNLDGVILMSPDTARTYLALIEAGGLTKKAAKPAYFCLSANVAAALDPLPGASVLVAASPTQDDLLALIGQDTAN